MDPSQVRLRSGAPWSLADGGDCAATVLRAPHDAALRCSRVARLRPLVFASQTCNDGSLFAKHETCATVSTKKNVFFADPCAGRMCDGWPVCYTQSPVTRNATLFGSVMGSVSHSKNKGCVFRPTKFRFAPSSTGLCPSGGSLSLSRQDWVRTPRNRASASPGQRSHSAGAQLFFKTAPRA